MEKLAVSAKSALLLILVTSPSVALDDDRLWLPTQYSRLFLDLKEAAKVVEAEDRCVTVLQGTLDVERSSDDHPVFRILCRQESGRSYNQMVDGKSFSIIRPPQEDTQDQRKSDLWIKCKEEFMDKTRLMRDVSADIDDSPPEPSVFKKEEVLYTFKFESKDAYGVNLSYLASCAFDENGVLSFKISGNR